MEECSRRLDRSRRSDVLQVLNDNILYHTSHHSSDVVYEGECMEMKTKRQTWTRHSPHLNLYRYICHTISFKAQYCLSIAARRPANWIHSHTLSLKWSVCGSEIFKSAHPASWLRINNLNSANGATLITLASSRPPWYVNPEDFEDVREHQKWTF